MKEKYQELLATLKRGFQQAQEINRAGSPTNIHRALEESMQECRGRIADLTRLQEKRRVEAENAKAAKAAAERENLGSPVWPSSESEGELSTPGRDRTPNPDTTPAETKAKAAR